MAMAEDGAYGPRAHRGALEQEQHQTRRKQCQHGCSERIHQCICGCLTEDPCKPHAPQVSTAMAEDGADVDALMARMDRLQSQIDAGEGWELERQLQRATDALRCPPGARRAPSSPARVWLHIKGCGKWGLGLSFCGRRGVLPGAGQ